MKSENPKPLAPVISLQKANTKTTEEEPLTIENLRACKRYENLTDEQITGIINSLESLIEIMVLTYLKNNSIIDNQQVIYLNHQDKQAA